MWGFFNVNALCIAFIYFIHHWLTCAVFTQEAVETAETVGTALVLSLRHMRAIFPTFAP
jgi:hypothetical protein